MGPSNHPATARRGTGQPSALRTASATALRSASRSRPNAARVSSHHPVLDPDQAEQQVLGADVVVSQRKCLAQGQLERLLAAPARTAGPPRRPRPPRPWSMRRTTSSGRSRSPSAPRRPRRPARRRTCCRGLRARPAARPAAHRARRAPGRPGRSRRRAAPARRCSGRVSRAAASGVRRGGLDDRRARAGEPLEHVDLLVLSGGRASCARPAGSRRAPRRSAARTSPVPGPAHLGLLEVLEQPAQGPDGAQADQRVRAGRCLGEVRCVRHGCQPRLTPRVDVNPC